jgi:hypothetical protein
MKGFWRHIAASASITAVFLVCAVALAVSAVPVATPPAHAPRGVGLSLTESCAGLVEALGTDGGRTPTGTPSAAAPAAEEAAQPDPATAAPARAERPPLLLRPGNPWLSGLN